MKKRVRLTPSEAKALNVGQKQLEDQKNPIRVVLNKEKLQELNQMRHEGVSEYCKTRGIDFNSIIEYWDKVVAAHHQLRGTNPKNFKRERIVNDLQPMIGINLRFYSLFY